MKTESLSKDFFMEIRIIHNLFYRKNNKLFVNIDGLLYDDSGDYHEITDHEQADDQYVLDNITAGIRQLAHEIGAIEVVYDDMREYLNYVMRGGY